jgi:hypothetical protein
MPRNILRVDSFHPTIGSAYHAVEGYLEYLATSSGTSVVAPPLALPPLDALLIHLLAVYQPTRPFVADLAAVPTWGVSTVLCRTDPALRQIVAPREQSTPPWRSILDHYLSERGSPLVDCVEVEGAREALERVANPHVPALVIAPSEDGTSQHSTEAVTNWLERAPRAVVVLLGVGTTGDCSALASLIACCTGSPYRLALPRELAPALAESRIALVSRRDNGVLDTGLTRIGHLFAKQFQFVDLIKRVCDSALEQSDLSDPLRGSPRAGVLDSQTGKSAYDLRRALAEREQELLALRQSVDDMTRSLTFRTLQRIRRLVRMLAPEGTSRRRLARLARSTLRVLHRGPGPAATEQPATTPFRRAS